MQKHHMYLGIGALLAVCGGAVSYFIPPLAGLHGAGLGLAIAGLIDRWYVQSQQS